jgi:anaerobic selenocysteine-containing dehydrogenase
LWWSTRAAPHRGGRRRALLRPPGTDPFLLLGIVHTLLKRDLATVTLEVAGLGRTPCADEEFSPEVAERVCGVPAADIARIARELAEAPTAVVYSRMGGSVVEFGTITQWLVDVINILTGNLDRPAGPCHADGRAGGVPHRAAVRVGPLAQPRQGFPRGARRTAHGQPCPTRSRHPVRDRFGR